MKGKIRTVVTILLALVFLGSGAVFLQQLYEQRIAEQAYEEAADIAWGTRAADDEVQTAEQELPEMQIPLKDEPEELVQQETVVEEPVAQELLPEQTQFLSKLDLQALREINEDVLGWIHIPDTNISYPLMRSEDNKEYLSLTWDLTRSAAGAIFLERRSAADLSDFHTLIYGHNMKNGSMFSDLRNYRKQEYLDSHPWVYIATDDAVLRYEVFSSYTAEVKSDTYRLLFADDGEKQRAIEFYLEQSEVESSLVPTQEDRILTLSTCTGLGNYDHRMVVQAVLTGEFPR